MPTLGLLLTISGLSLPTTINKYVSKNRTNSTYSSRYIILKSLLISLVTTTFISIIFLIFIKVLINDLLHNSNLYYPLILSIPLLFLSSMSNILKGYMSGLKKHELVSNNQFLETSSKLLIIILINLYFYKSSIVKLVSYIIISISLSELVSLLHLIYIVKKETKLTFEINPNYKEPFKPILKESLNITLTRLTSSIGLFLEPIIFTKALISIGYKNDVISLAYGIIEGYTMNLLLFTIFIIHSITSYILPLITELYSTNNYKKLKKLLSFSFFIVSFIAGISTIIIFQYNKEIMQLLYHTTDGTNFIHYMAFFYILTYFIPILVSLNQAINNTKKLLYLNIFIVVIKTISIYILSKNIYINIHGLTISSIISYTLSFIILYIFSSKIYKIKIKEIILFIISIIITILFSNFLNSIINLIYFKILFITIFYSIIYFTYYKLNKNNLLFFN